MSHVKVAPEGLNPQEPTTHSVHPQEGFDSRGDRLQCQHTEVDIAPHQVVHPSLVKGDSRAIPGSRPTGP